MNARLCHVVVGETCPVPTGEDRLEEANHFLTKLEDEYHDPRAFRYNLNAYLSSINSVVALLTKELEKRGDAQWWKKQREQFDGEPVLKQIARARNTTIHQKAIFDGSEVRIGLYRGRRHKLSTIRDLPGDIKSDALLKFWTESELGKMLLDEEHSAIGEQYGVWRLYHIKELSETEDVLTVCRRALSRAFMWLAAAHEILGVRTADLPEKELVAPDALSKVTVLLESDVDPTLFAKWGWSS